MLYHILLGVVSKKFFVGGSPVDFCSKSTDFVGKYLKRVQKRIAGKPLAMQLIMDRTFGTATWVLQLIEKVSFQKLTAGAYAVSAALPQKDLARQFEAQLELAGANEERFVLGLHAFYNNLSARIKKHHMEREFCAFSGRLLRLQFENTPAVDKDIQTAYVNLMMQTLEYLRPDKFDLECCVYGVSTDGEWLTAPCPFPYSDRPANELQQKILNGWRPSDPFEQERTILKLYAQYGIHIQSLDEIPILEQVQRIHINTATAMLPLIDEYTFDIIPERTFSTVKIPFLNLDVLLDTGLVSAQLRSCTKRLPPNGVFFEVDDPSEELDGVLLKETSYQDHRYCLFRVDTPLGGLSGYYDVEAAFFYSVLLESDSLFPYAHLRDMILLLYASQVLDSTYLTPASVMQHGHPVMMRAISQEGPRRDTYHKAADVDSGPIKKEPEPLPELPKPKVRSFRYQGDFPGQSEIFVSKIVN